MFVAKQTFGKISENIIRTAVSFRNGTHGSCTFNSNIFHFDYLINRVKRKVGKNNRKK